MGDKGNSRLPARNVTRPLKTALWRESSRANPGEWCFCLLDQTPGKGVAISLAFVGFDPGDNRQHQRPNADQ